MVAPRCREPSTARPSMPAMLVACVLALLALAGAAAQDYPTRELSADPVGTGVLATAAWLQVERERWSRVITTAGITAD